VDQSRTQKSNKLELETTVSENAHLANSRSSKNMMTIATLGAMLAKLDAKSALTAQPVTNATDGVTNIQALLSNTST
jgi:hypothetical protein